MKTKTIAFFIAAFTSITLLFTSCDKDKNDFGDIAIRLTDAPANYQQVNVDVQQVSVHLVPNSGKADWIDLNTKSGVYNLLKLQNGIDTSLVNTMQLPAGKITQIRLLLGNRNTLMADSVIYNLTVPSGSQTGIKLVGNITIDPNKALNVLLDFDAHESIVLTGKDTYQLKPTIKVL